MGKFGLISSQCYKGLVKLPKLMCTALRSNEHVISLFNELKEPAIPVNEKYFLAHVSAALELCEHTLLVDGVIRVHGHVMHGGSWTQDMYHQS